MHEHSWHDDLLPHWHIPATLFWAIVLVGVSFIIYKAFKTRSGKK